MPSSPRPARAARAALLTAAALAALAAAGCHRADPEVVPFAVRISDAAGAAVRPNVPGAAALVLVSGTAAVIGRGELRVADPALGAVTVTFDAAAHPFVAFPLRLDGKLVRVHAQYAPDAVAPGGTPVPYPALRVALAEGEISRYQLVLADSPASDGVGLPFTPEPLGPEPALGDSVDPTSPLFPDHPIFLVSALHARFEAGACGLVYHDVLVVEGTVLQAGEETGTVIEASPLPWTTRHVDSWHRTGACPGHAKAWTQWAAWR
jgi:hypothetical protein